MLKLQVIKYGQILFSRDEKLRVSFETKAIMDYLDFKKFDEIQNQALSRRLYGQALAATEDYELAESVLRKSISLNSKNAEAHLELAKVLRARNRYPEARKEDEQAATLQK